ncbi:hypothetical protein AYO47_04575 [Planctomyces sp. SCGC AG-212-M04]|nr:hypothetical protein AYO47_04575 [Planctomyces sp. SCGC AG-212-M04]
MCSEDPEKAGVFFYFMAAKLRNAAPLKEDAQQFRWHHARIKGGFEHWTLEYPTPPPVDFSDESIEQLMSGEGVLAPYFSTVLKAGNQVDYFILGQAPMGGGTTIRRITPEGINCNLGPGPKPEMKAFLARLLKNKQAE